MLIQRIKIDGLKGATTETRLGRLNLIQGPNGSGKTRILDGIRFALGQETAGVSPEGKNIAAAMAGSELRSEIDLFDGEFVTLVARERRLKGGTFSRSKLYIGGKQADNLDDLLGSFSPHKGRAFVDMSPDALLVAVSEIGARSSDEAAPLTLALEAAAHAYDRAWKAGDGPELERLQAVVSEIAGWRKAQRRVVREASASQDRSRRDLGAARVSPGLAEAKAEAAKKAGEKERSASESVGQYRSEASQIGRQIAELQVKLNAAGSGGEDLSAAVGAIEALQKELSAARGAELAALGEKDKTSAAHGELERSIQGMEDAIASLDSELASRRQAAQHLARASCARTTEWMALADQEEDPFAEPEDLCAVCPFPSKARKQAEGIPALETKISDMRAELEVETPKWAEATDAMTVAIVRFERAATDATDLSRRLAGAERRATEARLSAGVGGEQKTEWQKKITSLEAEKVESHRNLRRASADLEARGAEKATAIRDEREARILEERLRRLRDDEKRATDAEERLKLVEKLDGQAKRVARILAEAGEARILELGSALIVAPWTMAFDGGRVGLRGPGGEFWTGAGLSAAQRELLFSALDFALALIDEDEFRVAMIEADPIDLEARPLLISQIEAAVERGDLSQAFVCSWLPIEGAEAWTRIEVKAHEASEPDPFAEPEEEEEDPFAAPAWSKRVEEADGPGLTAFLEAIKEEHPGAYQKIPRRLNDRRRLVIELAEELDDSEREELFQ